MKDKGFTLIELIVALAVFVLILSMGLPSMAAYRERKQVDTIDLRLSQALEYAKLQVLLRGEPLVLGPIPGERNFNRGTALYRAAKFGVDTNTKEPLHEWFWSYPNVAVDWHGSRNAYLVFTPELSEGMMNGTFTIKGQFSKKKLVINRVGRVRSS